MATKVDQASPIEPRPPQISGNSKVSKFGLKSGFVIPKNKLSGSLVPAFRSAAKVDNDTVKEDSSKPIQRKTKWGTDLTQDASVRKGRALAYQTRVEQITKQLKSGVLNKEDEDLSSQPGNENPSESSGIEAADQSKKLEMELEKREAIGEILKLNPSYKAPLDYKPLMKEASVPVPAVDTQPLYTVGYDMDLKIPSSAYRKLEDGLGLVDNVTRLRFEEHIKGVNQYPGINFIGLILGPGSNTQKRLEEETGTRIRIHGTKAGSTEMVEITSSDKNDAQVSYEELYVHVSADTFEKIDAAVSLIELLVTPVSGNSVAVSTAPPSVSEPSQDNSSSNLIPSPVVNPGMMQSSVGPMQPGFLPQGQFQQYPNSWCPSGPMRPPNNFTPMSNSSPPMLNNVVQFPSNMPPQFSSPRQQPPPPPQQGGLQWPYLPPNSQAGPPPRNHPSQHLVYPHHHPMSQGNQLRTPPPLSYGRLASNPPQPVVQFQRPPPPQQPLPSRPVTGQNFSFVVHQRPNPVPPMSRAPPVPPPLAPPPPVSVTPISTLPVVTSPSPATTPRPQRPSSGDFTFKPSPVATPSPAPPQPPPTMVQPPPSQSFRPPGSSPLFSGNQSPMMRPPPRFPNQLPPISPPATSHMVGGPRSFTQFPMNPPPPQPLQPPQMQRPGSFYPPNQQNYGNNPGFQSGGRPPGNQVYDPFSPSSENPTTKAKKQEEDPEYDDLMASVGVR